ncbi:MAG TPA: hypothetical protein VGG28_23895 [Kofleriaceae bacterium]
MRQHEIVPGLRDRHASSVSTEPIVESRADSSRDVVGRDIAPARPRLRGICRAHDQSRSEGEPIREQLAVLVRARTKRIEPELGAPLRRRRFHVDDHRRSIRRETAHRVRHRREHRTFDDELGLEQRRVLRLAGECIEIAE